MVSYWKNLYAYPKKSYGIPSSMISYIWPWPHWSLWLNSGGQNLILCQFFWGVGGEGLGLMNFENFFWSPLYRKEINCWAFKVCKFSLTYMNIINPKSGPGRLKWVKMANLCWPPETAFFKLQQWYSPI